MKVRIYVFMAFSISSLFFKNTKKERKLYIFTVLCIVFRAFLGFFLRVFWKNRMIRAKKGPLVKQKANSFSEKKT